MSHATNELVISHNDARSETYWITSAYPIKRVRTETSALIRYSSMWQIPISDCFPLLLASMPAAVTRLVYPLLISTL